jgi:putative flippase GtrA
MHDEATVVDAPRGSVDVPPGSVEVARGGVPTSTGIRPHIRVLHGMRRPANWMQLVRFGIVGGVGFVVNVVVYTICVHPLGLDYHLANVLAWMVAVANNFILNRHWTFDARGGMARFQAARFLVVSLIAEGFSLLALTVLVEVASMGKVPAQVLAVAAVTPLNFLGNKLWSFRDRG